MAAGQIERAVRSAADSLTALRQANLLRARSEVFAWVAAASGAVHAAAQLIGAGETFASQSENQRDPISKMARQRALALIESGVGDGELQYWLSQ